MKHLCKHATASAAIKLLFLYGMLYFADALKAQPQLSFSPLIQNLSKPLEVKNAGDSSDRLFIVEQTGLIKIYKNGGLLNKPFLDLSSMVSLGYFPGLHSIAFSPNYKADRTFFVKYVDTTGNSVLARYRAGATNPDQAIQNSGVVLLRLRGNAFGQLQFGKDGYLYITINDKSGRRQTSNSAQEGNVLYGKMLRLNVVNVNVAPYYTIPPDNPFVNDPDVRDEIFAFGLRNAWRWSFDRASGNMFLPDVGGDNREEVNMRKFLQSVGANYGWPCYEGNQPFVTTGCTNKDDYVFPIFSYPHNNTNGGYCIIGGYVYRGSSYPTLKGYYICSDFTTSNAWKIKPNDSGGFDALLQKNIPAGIAGYGEGENGELYAASLDGTVYSVGVASPFAQSGVPLSGSGKVAPGEDAKTNIYPTIVNNNTIILELGNTYNFIRIFNMTGKEVMRQNLNGRTGNVTINLPELSAGFYIVQLVGTRSMQQKIYVTK